MMHGALGSSHPNNGNACPECGGTCTQNHAGSGRNPEMPHMTAHPAMNPEHPSHPQFSDQPERPGRPTGSHLRIRGGKRVR